MADLTKDDLASVTIRDFFRFLATDKQGAEARKVYCREVAEAAENLSSWLAVDAMLGAGDTRDLKTDEPSISPERRRAFVAVSLVAQMSSELVKGSVTLLLEGNEYACSGLIRQLIECEYLFRAFQINFSDATKWMNAPPSAKYDFSPANLRKIGGFDHEEYSNHCEAGGHPRPGGRHLLELQRLMSDLPRTDGRERDEVNLMLWLDLALHCERTWKALVGLLAQEHARFDAVPRAVINVDRVHAAHATWLAADQLARHVGPVLSIMAADPDTPLSHLINLENPAMDVESNGGASGLDTPGGDAAV